VLADKDRYNSVIVNVQPANAYVWVFVTPAFVDGSPFDIVAANKTDPFLLRHDDPFDFNETISDLQQCALRNRSGLTELNWLECLRHYREGFNDASSVAVVVIEHSPIKSENSLIWGGSTRNP
jgi:hypothetical protein